MGSMAQRDPHGQPSIGRSGRHVVGRAAGAWPYPANVDRLRPYRIDSATTAVHLRSVLGSAAVLLRSQSPRTSPNPRETTPAASSVFEALRPHSQIFAVLEGNRGERLKLAWIRVRIVGPCETCEGSIASRMIVNATVAIPSTIRALLAMSAIGSAHPVIGTWPGWAETRSSHLPMAG